MPRLPHPEKPFPIGHSYADGILRVTEYDLMPISIVFDGDVGNCYAERHSWS